MPDEIKMQKLKLKYYIIEERFHTRLERLMHYILVAMR